mmetsp:Transcript_3697/g.10830  ORF Transcript_3697/g.10830 Transcript_3697/m.10830 type:complete len:216 (-) Transcript_3697:114-761(-)
MALGLLGYRGNMLRDAGTFEDSVLHLRDERSDTEAINAGVPPAFVFVKLQHGHERREVFRGQGLIRIEGLESVLLTPLDRQERECPKDVPVRPSHRRRQAGLEVAHGGPFARARQATENNHAPRLGSVAYVLHNHVTDLVRRLPDYINLHVLWGGLEGRQHTSIDGDLDPRLKLLCVLTVPCHDCLCLELAKSLEGCVLSESRDDGLGSFGVLAS